MKNPKAFLCSALLVPLEPLRYLYATRTLQAIYNPQEACL